MVSDMRENHFESNAAGSSANEGGPENQSAKKGNGEEEVLREDDVDEEFFAFPNQENAEEKELEKQ